MARTQPPDVATGSLRDDRVDLLRRSHTRFTASNGHLYAAAIAYFSLISMFPGLIFLVTVLAWVAPDPAVQHRVVDQIVDQFPPGARIRLEIRSFVSEIATMRSGLLGAAGLAMTIVVASEAFRSLRYALNALDGKPQTRSFLRGRSIDVLGMVAVLTFGLISTGMTALMADSRFQQHEVLSGPGGAFAVNVALIVLPFVLSFVAFTLMYRVVLEQDYPWSILWIPGLISATGFELARLSMGLFIANFDRFQALYGALSVTVVLLVFIFLVANVVLLAGSLVIELDRARTTREESTTPSLTPRSKPPGQSEPVR